METETGRSSLHINNDDGKRARRHEDDDDGISTLPDDILLLILQRLDLITAVRADAVARRWRRLPRLLTDLNIDVDTLIPQHKSDFSTDHAMAACTDATAWFLLPPPDTQHQQKITSVRLAFYLVDGPYLRTIGDAIAATTADRIDLDIQMISPDLRATYVVPDFLARVFVRRLTSFLGACPAAFARLTSLSLHDITFFSTSIKIADLLNACHRLELLSLTYCAVSVIKIDAPGSLLLALELHSCSVHRVELTRVPKLEGLLCDARTSVGSMTFRCVPCLRAVDLSALHLRRYFKNPALLSAHPRVQ